MTIKLKNISDTISKAYDISPKFAEDMNRAIEQYAEYYYKLFLRDWERKNNEKNSKGNK
jgi:hypothetical protein